MKCYYAQHVYNQLMGVLMSTGSSVLTVRIPADVKAKLDKLAEATKRSKSFLAQEAITHYIDLESWQIAEIHKAIGETDAGDFATDDEITAVTSNWGVHAG